MEEPEIHECSSDEELSKKLHQLLVVEGHPNVEIHHPTEGRVVLTKENYQETLKHLAKVKEMSPAERMMEHKRQVRKEQMKFRTAMITAETVTVDIDDDSSFGLDVDGNKIDIEGKTFVPVAVYLKGMEPKKNEIGCFVDESQRKPPIRILAKPDQAAAEIS